MINFQVALLNNFTLRPEHRRLLKNYYVLHWQVEYLVRKLNDDGTLTHADCTYVPVYKDSLPADPSAQLMLSFRKQTDVEYPDIPNIVLIKVKNREDKK